MGFTEKDNLILRVGKSEKMKSWKVIFVGVLVFGEYGKFMRNEERTLSFSSRISFYFGEWPKSWRAKRKLRKAS